MKRIRQWLVTGAGALFVTLGGLLTGVATPAEGTFDRTLKVTGAVDLVVTTGSGDIRVLKGDMGSVHVHARIRVSSNWGMASGEAEQKVRALETNPPIEQTGNSIRVGEIRDEELRRHVSISYDIEAPAETSLTARTGSGHGTVEGLRGPVRIDSGSGPLAISNIGDAVRAETGSGDIEINMVKGSLEVRTGSGAIRGLGIGGGINAETGSGNVRLEQSAQGSVRVKSGSGTVELARVRGGLQVRTGSGDISASGEPSGEWKLQTGSGTLTVRVPPAIAFDLDAHTSSGHIDTNQPITVQGTIGRGHLQGKVRGGGVLISLDTGSGNIRIE